MWFLTHRENIVKASVCRSGILLPCCTILTTFWLSVNHLTLSFSSCNWKDSNTSRTALNSCHVELCLDSFSDQCPLAILLPCSTKYPPYPVELASEYTSQTADGWGQICCPLKFSISPTQNLTSIRASGVNTSF